MVDTNESTGRSTGMHLHFPVGDDAQSAYDRWVMTGPDATTDAAQLSRMLFESRELVIMFRDVIKRTSGKDSQWADRVVKEIDEYRAAHGWNPHGFGGEE